MSGAKCYFCDKKGTDFSPLGCCINCSILACGTHGDYNTNVPEFLCIHCQGKWLVGSAIVGQTSQLSLSEYRSPNTPLDALDDNSREEITRFLQSFHRYQPNQFNQIWVVNSVADFGASIPRHMPLAQELATIRDKSDFFDFRLWEESRFLRILLRLWNTPTAFQKNYYELMLMSAILIRAYRIEEFVAPYLTTMERSLRLSISPRG